MTQQLPPGQGPIDPRNAFAPPPSPAGGPGGYPPPGFRPGAPPMFFPPPPRRSGVGRAIILTLLILLLLVSLLLNFVLGVSAVVGDAFSEHGVVQTTIKSGDATQEIAVVPLSGVITDGTRTRFDHFMQRADEDKSIKALVLEIDSPGGEVTPSDEIYARIIRFKQEHPGVPIVASMRSMATSGAYYAACGADHLMAEQTTVTGSIGVLWPRFNVADLMKRWGVKDTTIVSTGTPYKDAGSPFQTADLQTEGYLQGLVDTAFKRFKSVVSSSRGKNLKAGIDSIANGKAYTAQEALDNGLVDEIGYMDDALTWAASNAHLSHPHVVKYEEKVNLMDRFPFAQSSLGSPKSQGVNINGVNINVDREALDALMHSRLMYLWNGQ
jgi:protease-4